jgi:hypothetical protein
LDDDFSGRHSLLPGYGDAEKPREFNFKG